MTPTSTLILTAALSLAGISVAHAQTDAKSAGPPLTLDAAVDEGLNNSPDIQRAKAEVGESKWKHNEALGEGFLPKLSISGVHYIDTQYTLTTMNFDGANLTFPGFYPTTQASLNVMVPIFNGLSSLHGLQAASLLNDASEQELTNSQFQLSQAIRTAYYEALAASLLQIVADQNVRTLEDHLRQVQIRRHGGAATNYDTLRVQVQLSEAKADAVDATDAYVLARRKLTQLLGRENDDRPLTGELPVPDAAKVTDLQFSEVPKERADIQALSLRAQAASRAESASKAWFVPEISVGGQYLIYDQQYFNNTVQDTGNYQNAYNVGVFLTWNLFDGGVAIAKANEASYRSIEAERSSQSAKLKVPYDFAYWKRRYISNSEHYQSKKFDITRSEESVRLAKEEERAGSRTSTETLDAELDLFKARAGAVNAQLNAVEAQIQLEIALGRRI